MRLASHGKIGPAAYTRSFRLLTAVRGTVPRRRTAARSAEPRVWSSMRVGGTFGGDVALSHEHVGLWAKGRMRVASLVPVGRRERGSLAPPEPPSNAWFFFVRDDERRIASVCADTPGAYQGTASRRRNSAGESRLNDEDQDGILRQHPGAADGEVVLQTPVERRLQPQPPKASRRAGRAERREARMRSAPAVHRRRRSQYCRRRGDSRRSSSSPTENLPATGASRDRFTMLDTRRRADDSEGQATR